MIKFKDNSGFKIEDFRYNKTSDGWARLAIRLSWILVVLLAVLIIDFLGIPILTFWGRLYFVVSLFITGFVDAAVCSRSHFFTIRKRFPYMVNSLIAVGALYVGYLGIFYIPLL